MRAGVLWSRSTGWVLAALAALSLLGGAAAFALGAERREPMLFLDLAAQVPAAPPLSALAETAPEVLEEAASIPDEPEPAETLPRVPEETPLPVREVAAPLAFPSADVPVAIETSVPRPKDKPAKAVESKPERTTPPKKAENPKAAAAKPKAEPEETKKDAEDKAAAAPAASAPGSKAKGGGLSPAAYAKAVMKKVRGTRKINGAGKGTVVVGFAIADDGGLAEVRVLQGSGDAALDQRALDHIRRSAPFPVPPPDAGRRYSFEFVGR